MCLFRGVRLCHQQLGGLAWLLVVLGGRYLGKLAVHASR